MAHRGDLVGSHPEGLPAPPVRDFRGAVDAPLTLQWPAGHRVVVSGLPGSGKSTLMRRAVVDDGTLIRVDSQEARERWARRLPAWLPYSVYRPVVRLAHYAGLWRALRSPAGVLVHDCGRMAWVRRWLGRDARRRGRGFHLVLLDVPAETALAGQRDRGRTVSRHAFAGHQRALGRLIAEVAAGRLPPGCHSAVLLDRPAADALDGMVFAKPGVPADDGQPIA
ncbi:AAA family ATPase [Streptomyces litchfieldiae]|uniref:AAA family ATPase n=1 Tax=Streptomyces litchfieldiae TaxID=3075543 RepID=A0ABU2MQY3_9ACTN|nr:AAA family ATPase [Streptomyces sp. DSM 44938]MDT0343499.1 AAA family ATPase [Streptomyces sp. DSM 44938]